MSKSRRRAVALALASGDTSSELDRLTRERDEARAALAEVGRLLEALGDPCAYHESKLARVEALIATYDPDTNGGQDWIAGVKVATELSAAIRGDRTEQQ